MFDKGEQGDYGFFCDLENARTMDYDKVEYYVVTTRTHYEVRRKFAGSRIVKTQPQSRLEIQRTEHLPQEEQLECTRERGSIIQILSRLPRDIYYSLAVCCTTASCVYFIMTYE